MLVLALSWLCLAWFKTCFVLACFKPSLGLAEALFLFGFVLLKPLLGLSPLSWLKSWLDLASNLSWFLAGLGLSCFRLLHVLVWLKLWLRFAWFKP